jgi:hypothetical protein
LFERPDRVFDLLRDVETEFPPAQVWSSRGRDAVTNFGLATLRGERCLVAGCSAKELAG